MVSTPLIGAYGEGWSAFQDTMITLVVGNTGVEIAIYMWRERERERERERKVGTGGKK